MRPEHRDPWTRPGFIPPGPTPPAVEGRESFR